MNWHVFIETGIFKLTEEWLIYNVVLISAVYYSDSVIRKHTHTHIYPCYILFHWSLSQDIEFSSLWTQ